MIHLITSHRIFGLWSQVFSRLRGHPEGPEALSARCSTFETEVIAEVPLAKLTPTLKAVQGSWKGLAPGKRDVGFFLHKLVRGRSAFY